MNTYTTYTLFEFSCLRCSVRFQQLGRICLAAGFSIVWSNSISRGGQSDQFLISYLALHAFLTWFCAWFPSNVTGLLLPRKWRAPLSSRLQFIHSPPAKFISPGRAVQYYYARAQSLFWIKKKKQGSRYSRKKKFGKFFLLVTLFVVSIFREDFLFVWHGNISRI